MHLLLENNAIDYANIHDMKYKLNRKDARLKYTKVVVLTSSLNGRIEKEYNNVMFWYMQFRIAESIPKVQKCRLS